MEIVKQIILRFDKSSYTVHPVYLLLSHESRFNEDYGIVENHVILRSCSSLFQLVYSYSKRKEERENRK